MTTMADTLYGGRYRLVHRIARGGMGEVWRASDELLQRPVAIKLLREDLVGDPGFIGRFRAEARNTAVLSHPGIAQLHDYGEQAGRAYIVMELVEGHPLSWILAREGALSPDRALRYAGQAALALQVAHDSGVIHRDVKPANLIVTPSEQVKITDFGIAKAVGDGTLTATGQVMGTAEYLSPEQAIGGAATPLSDLYALGIVLYECLAGRRPFANGNPVKIALAQVHEQPPPLSGEIPEPVRNLVLRLLAKEPSERPQGGAVLAREIAHLLSDEWHVDSKDSSQRAIHPPGFRDNGTFIQASSPPASAPQQDPQLPSDAGATTIRPHPDEYRDETLIVRSTARTVSTESTGRHSRTDQAMEHRSPRRHNSTGRTRGRRRAPRQRIVDLDRITTVFNDPTNRLIAIAVAVVTLVLLIGFMAGRSGGRDVGQQGILVPGVRGVTLTEARQQLADRGLEVLVTYTVTDSSAPDVVIDQRPEPEVLVDADTVIHLTVSSSESSHALPLMGASATEPRALALWNKEDPVETDAGHIFGRIPGTVAGVVHIPPAQYGATRVSAAVLSCGDSDTGVGKGND